MTVFRLGGVELTPVLEWSGPVATAREIVPDSSTVVWDSNADWLAPDFWGGPESDAYHASIHTWVLKSEGKTILIDTGVGNHKSRPSMPVFSGWDTDYLDRLERAGAHPDDVDIVINTHLHSDHVGWNTKLSDDTWVPSFPNAEYLIHRADYEFFNPALNPDAPSPEVFEDSVAPVWESDQVTLWEGSHTVDANLQLLPAPGHTPGSSVVMLSSGSDRALFVGDLLHSPVQIFEPDCNSCFCIDAEQARATRRRTLEQAADLGALIFPAHFAGTEGWAVQRNGSHFEITRRVSPAPVL